MPRWEEAEEIIMYTLQYPVSNPISLAYKIMIELLLHQTGTFGFNLVFPRIFL